MTEETVNVGDPAQVKKRKKKHQIKREQELEDMRQILKTSFGKGFIWRVLSKCHMFHTISHQEPTRMAVSSGERDIGLWVMAELNAADPNAYMKLYQAKQKRDDK